MKLSSLAAGPLNIATRGVALVLVLAFLVVISALVLAFFSSAQTELVAAKSYASGASTRQLADSTVQTVMGLIAEGTARGEDVAWTSQPGMIKTYGDGSKSPPTASPEPLTFYKLYSADPQVLTDSATIRAWKSETEIPADWDKKPGLFTDLNEPVTDRFETKNYPIIDPRAATDPAVQGFKLDTPPGGSKNEAAMPVRWLYVLEDGSLSAPVSSDGAKVEFANGAPADKLPSRENPIVGRVAFWTDDDSCKININTAGGDEWKASEEPGSFWDTPRVGSQWEKDYLAKSQPFQKEYQRYPGHPATTYLSAVFPDWKRSEIYDIVPRVTDGGSRGGTVNIPVDGAKPDALVADADRLYASVDELMFRYDPTRAGGLDLREPNNTLLSSQGSLDRRALERVRFFLTAHSRAPEVNLFNRPRVMIWPVHRLDSPKDKYHTPFDDLIAFCGGIGPKDGAGGGFRQNFFYRRGHPRSAIMDIDATAATKEETADAGALNRRMSNYLRRLTGKPIPGFGGGFNRKWTVPERDQIILEIFDYIRSTNIHDTSTPQIEPFAPKINVKGHGEIIPIRDTLRKSWRVNKDGDREDLKGFGRFPTISEVALLIWVKSESRDEENKLTRRQMRAALLIEPYNVAHGFVVYHPNHELFAEGLNNFHIAQARRPNNQALPRPNLQFQPQAVLKVDDYSGVAWHQRGWGGLMGPAPLIAMRKLGDADEIGDYTFCSKDFRILVRDDDPETEFMKLHGAEGEGSPIEFSITARLPDGGEKVQTIHFSFPAVEVPVPKKSNIPIMNKSTPRNPDRSRLDAITSNSSQDATKNYWKHLIHPEDMVRSLEISPDNELGGDPRLYTLREELPLKDSKGRSYYLPNWEYENRNKRVLHSMRTASGNAYISDNFPTEYGKLVAKANYRHVPGSGDNPLPWSNRPGLSSRFGFAEGANSAGYDQQIGVGFENLEGNFVAGDWDTGIGPVADGAFINKADDGQIDTKGSAEVIPYYSEQRDPPGPTYFTPARVMTSPVTFGSLSSGSEARPPRPWQTLLFCPNPAAGPETAHPGFGTPRQSLTDVTSKPHDHLLLDLFQMPVVEPYAITEPLSTAGKVNLNYQILPFTYIRRDTALRAVLRSTRVSYIGTGVANKYKNDANTPSIRHQVDLDETLEGFEKRFKDPTPIASGNSFRSASEICEMYLVPEGKKLNGMQQFWKTPEETGLTGDNLRERPYSEIYPRVTTKSNTYTVHMRVQTLKQAATSNPAVWTEGRDQVLGEYRGSSTIERYVDPAEPKLPNYVQTAEGSVANELTLDHFYKFRILTTKRFQP
ncbi:MAG: Verru_Chthon cassette protein A [Verrucomicrobiota bacterium]|nr:Verru_Chthon cassette protein A [Verrucomicrobiota bacterium]